MTKLLTFIILLFLFAFAFGQEFQEQVKVELVQVDVVASDSKGKVVTDLTQQDFTLKENGKVQPITHFYNAANDQIRYPLTISFVVDTSGSMQELVAGMTRIQVAVKAAEMVMKDLKANDHMELIEFNEKPVEIVPFTDDVDVLEDKLEALDFKEADTAMHDAVVFSLDKIKNQSGRKIVVIFSDGMDTASKSVEQDAVQALRNTDATFVAFYSEFARLNFPAAGGGFGGDPSSMNRVKIRTGEDLLRQYTEISGGEFFSFRKEPELLKAIESFRAIVGSQYTLAFTPSAGKKKEWRKLKVECKRKGIHLRYREGYMTG
jgi:Ca-activated chloride channel family protein